MTPEKLISEFTTRMRTAAGENLQSLVLYGSAADGEFHAEYSDINLLCVVRDTSFRSLQALAPAVKWWLGQKQPAPQVATGEELRRSADVFAIELLDMQQRHRILFGDDVLGGLKVDLRNHRAQVEYELREKLMLLRKGLLMAGDKQDRLWDLLLNSLSAFTTLFRHASLALNGGTPVSKREAAEGLAARIQFDSSPFMQLLAIRERRAERKQFDPAEIFARYLAAIEQVAAAVDTMFDSGT
ncbi:MAG TPA: nucleotidyltransferase domain-containing protein [Terriglobales bacterium]|jgi:hypothetical protein|nr:nucleotidyltransferase domain-containing protein [Terriglobales bacterium]